MTEGAWNTEVMINRARRPLIPCTPFYSWMSQGLELARYLFAGKPLLETGNFPRNFVAEFSDSYRDE